MRKCAILLLVLIWIEKGFTAGLLPPYFPPYIRWFTMETSHFYIHFHKGLEEVAEEIASIAEKDYHIFEAFISDLPSVKTHVILTYFTDISNGFTLPFPHPSIYLYLTPPSPYSELIYTKDWLESLFLHEFAHVVYLERAGGFPKVLRTVFGRVYFPNLFAPYLITEGYAVWNEKRFLGRSRLRSSFYNMILRIALLHKKEEKYSSFSLLYPSHWPYGVVPYLYGSYILDYIAQEKGEECVDRYTVYYSENIIPFLVNNSFTRACGISFKEAWRRLKERERGKIGRKRETLGRRITFTGNETRGVRFFDESRVVITVNSMDEYPYVGIVDIRSHKLEKLKFRNSGYHLSVYKGVIYYSEMEYMKNFFLLSDVFSLKDGEKQRITKGDRWFSPEKVRLGLYAIKRTPIASGICEVKTNRCVYETQGEVLSFRFSNSGDKIVFSEKRQNGNVDIGIIDLLTGRSEFITEDVYNDLFPLFSPDDRYVIFSSDKNSISNLYAIELTSLIRYQITDVVGGVFEADVSPDHRYIATVQYSVDGFDVYLIEYAPEKWKKLHADEVESYEVSKPQIRSLEVKKYNGFKYLLPRAWIPYVWYGDIEGFFTQIKTGGSDPLFKHIYILDVYYQWKIKKPGASFFYIEDSFYPTLVLHSAELPKRGPIRYSSGEEFWVSRFIASLSLSFPVIKKMRWSFYAGAGYRFRWYRADEKYVLYSGDAIGRSGDINLWLNFDSRKYYVKSFTIEDGVRTFGSYRRLHRTLGGEYSGEEWFFHFEGYKELFNWAVAFIKGDYIRYRGYEASPLLPVAGIRGDVKVYGIKSDVVTDTAGSAYAGINLPIYLIDRGIALFPLSFRYIYFSIYGGMGFVRSGANEGWLEIPSVGVDIGIQMFAGYVLPLTFKFSVSKGFNEFSDWRYDYRITIGGLFFNRVGSTFPLPVDQSLQDILNTDSL